MTDGWSILMGPQGGALNEYLEYYDFAFSDRLWDFGGARLWLGGLSGNAAPQKGWVIKFLWNKGLSDEQTHWQGIIDQAQQKQEGNVFVIRAYTIDHLLHTGITGEVRNWGTSPYTAATVTPYTIMQAAGTPKNLLSSLITDAGPVYATVLPYGTAAVPLKVDAVNPGLALYHFVSDSASLFNNMRRLCAQSKYDAGSVGLEWATTLEGGNASTPFFYLVKRRNRATGYTPETFDIPTDFPDAKRGTPNMAGVSTVRVIGAGDGNSRFYAYWGTGVAGREVTLHDKSLFDGVTAAGASVAVQTVNMARRLFEIYDQSIEVVNGVTFKHSHATRAGDDVTVTQTGFANNTLRCVERFYSLRDRCFTFLLGRPMEAGRDAVRATAGVAQTDQSTPQFTDLVVPSQFPSGGKKWTITGAGMAALVAAGGSNTGTAIAPPALITNGDFEGYFAVVRLVIDPASVRAGGTIEVIPEFDFASNPGAFQDFTAASFGDPAIDSTNLQTQAYLFRVNHPISGDATFVSGRLLIRNRGANGVTVVPASCSVDVYFRPKHRHNEL